MVQIAMQTSSDMKACLPLSFPAAAAAKPGQQIRILVVAADPLYRAALCWTLLRARPDAVITEAGWHSEAADALRSDAFSLALLDGDTFGGGLLGVLQELRAQSSAALAILSSDASRSAARRALDYGACGYIAKSTPLAEMTAMLCKWAERAARRHTPLQLVETIADDGDNALTPAQARVLALVEKGRINKQIAHEMGIAESTVKAHVSAIFRKLNVQNRVQAILAVNRLDGVLQTAQVA